MIFEKYDTIYLSDKWFCLLFGQNGAFITTLRQWVLSRLVFCKLKLRFRYIERTSAFLTFTVFSKLISLDFSVEFMTTI